MPDPETPDTSGSEKPGAKPSESPASDTVSGIHPAMSEQEIRDAGLAIDVPFETSGEPERLRYGNLGKTWKPDETDGASG